MADRPGRPEEDDTKTSDASPVPAGQEDAAKPAASPEAANESDATNPQTDRAAADTEEKPEPSGSDEPAPDEPAAPPSATSHDVPDSKPAAPTEDADSTAAEGEPAVDWEGRATAAEKELAELKLKVAAQNAAAEAGLPAEAAQFLRGDNDEEIKAAAETLASLITPSSPLDRNPTPRGQEPDDRPDLATIGARLFRN